MSFRLSKRAVMFSSLRVWSKNKLYIHKYQVKNYYHFKSWSFSSSTVSLYLSFWFLSLPWIFPFSHWLHHFVKSISIANTVCASASLLLLLIHVCVIVSSRRSQLWKKHHYLRQHRYKMIPPTSYCFQHHLSSSDFFTASCCLSPCHSSVC